MIYEHVAIPDAEVPQTVEPVFQHVVTTYASEVNKTASVWRAVPDDLLDFRPQEKTNPIRTIFVHQLLSERRFFAQFTGLNEPPVEELLPPGEKPTVQAYIDQYVKLAKRRLPQFAAGTTAWWLEQRDFFGGLKRERIWVFWRRVLHTCHHRTQVQTWLRLAGRHVPAIYGPSGDVKWSEADPTYSLEAARRGGPVNLPSTSTERAMDSVPKEMFQSMYAGQAPWDIGRPQPAFLAIADQIAGSVLDAGCGTGDHALYLADRGCQVTGIDFVEEAIIRAKKKAEGRNLPVTFLVKDALDLKGWGQRFDNVIDSGLFHVFSDQDRQRYVEGLGMILKPGGRLFLMCFSDEEPGTQGPRRVSQQELKDAFAHGWVVESVESSRFEVVPNLKDMQFSEGGPKAWFAVIRRAR